MTTKQLVSYLQRRTGYNSSDILATINDVVQYVYGKDCTQFLYIDSSTGLPPVLDNPDGDRSVSFPDGTYDVNVRRTLYVLTKSLSREYYGQGWDKYFFSQEEFYRVPLSENKDRTEGTPAKVSFGFDPGEGTQTFYHLFYVSPTEITSVNIEIPIPPNYHLALREICLKLIQGEDFGMEMTEYINKNLAKRIWGEMNASFGTRDHRVPIRPEYRHYETYNRGYRYGGKII